MAANKEYQRKYNRQLILNAVRNNEGISRVEIARKLGLDKSTVSYITNREAETEVFLEKEKLSETAGRVPIGLFLNPERYFFWGVDVGRDEIRISIVDFAGKNRFQGCFPFSFTGELNFQRILIDKIDSVLKSGQFVPPELMVISLPGAIGEKGNTLSSAYSLELAGSICLEALFKAFPFTVIIENDARCSGWHLYSKNYGKSLLSLYLTRRQKTHFEMGYSLIHDGRIFRGAHNRAGEIDSDKIISIVEQLAEKRDREDWSPIVDENLIRLADWIEPLVGLADPDILLFSGEFCQFESIKKNKDYWDQRFASQTIIIPDYGIYEASDGAAFMAREEFFKYPEVD